MGNLLGMDDEVEEEPYKIHHLINNQELFNDLKDEFFSEEFLEKQLFDTFSDDEDDDEISD